MPETPVNRLEIIDNLFICIMTFGHPWQRASLYVTQLFLLTQQVNERVFVRLKTRAWVAQIDTNRSNEMERNEADVYKLTVARPKMFPPT